MSILVRKLGSGLVQIWGIYRRRKLNKIYSREAQMLYCDCYCDPYSSLYSLELFSLCSNGQQIMPNAVKWTNLSRGGVRYLQILITYPEFNPIDARKTFTCFREPLVNLDFATQRPTITFRRMKQDFLGSHSG
jgi:hypothetical protein